MFVEYSSNHPDFTLSTLTMQTTTLYPDDPNFTYTMNSPISKSFTANTTIAPETVTEVTRLDNLSSSWEVNVFEIEIADELKTVYMNRQFLVDTFTT